MKVTHIKKMRISSSQFKPFVLPVLLILFWWILSTNDLINSTLVVSPVTVVETAYEQIFHGKLLAALIASFLRELTGFLIGSSIGLILGMLLGLSNLADRIIGPSFNTFKQISLFAWIPLISVWFGLGDVAKVVFLSLAAVVPVVVNTYEGVRGVSAKYLEVAQAFGWSKLQIILEVIIPAALPSIFTGIYLALIYSWLATIGAEYLLVSGVGIGSLLVEGSEHFRMDLVIFAMIIIGLVGWAMNASARMLQHRFERWRN
jgi:sulfonate transport system permease protein